MALDAVGILASAGTGKTHRLTTRLLRLLLLGVPPESVLASTFTRTAAGEILDRVLRRICEASVDERGLRRLSEEVDIPALTGEGCRTLAASLARRIDRLAITTLDAFMMRVASAFAVELGLPPGWRIAGDDEDAHMREAAVTRVLREGGREVIIPLLRMLKKSEGSRSVHQSIADTVNAVHRMHLQSVPGAWESVRATDRPLSAEAFNAALERCRGCALPATQAGTPNKTWQKAHTAAIELLAAGDWLGFLGAGLGKARSDNIAFSRIEFQGDIADVYAVLVGHARAMAVGALVNQNLAAGRLAERFAAAYSDIKGQRGGVLFDDLPRLLLAGELTHVREELYYRLDARIDHVLLDEFQDTSLSQFRVLEPLLEELVSDETRPRSVFYVGDAKQSLFGWRDAEPRLLAHLGEHWPQIAVERLAQSFRSSPVVMEAVNRVFADLARNPAIEGEAAGAAAAEWDRLFAAHSWDRGLDNVPGRVILRQYPDELAQGGRGSLTDGCWDFVADRVAAIRGEAPAASIAVLVRTKANIPRLLMALAHRGIDASEEGGSPITQSPAVAAVVSLLRLSEHPGDTLAAFHVATTALGEFVGLDRRSDPAVCASVATAIREQITRDGIAAAVGAWARWLAPACTGLDRGRLMQLVEAAEQYDARGSIGVPGFLALVESTRRPAASVTGVRIMTVHAAKGLEFDAVILPELDGKVPAHSPDVVFDRAHLLGPVTRISLFAAEPVQRASEVLAALARERRTREILESLCLLYVAMTRARRYLEMIVLRPPQEGRSLRLAYIPRYALQAPDDPEPDGLLWQNGTDAWHQGLVRPAQDAPGTDLAPPEVGPAADCVVLGMLPGDGEPPVRTASDAEDRTPTPAGAALGRDRARLARGLGTGVHACLEQVAWADDAPISDAALLAFLSRVDLPPDCDPARIVAAFRDALRRPGFRGLLSRERYLRTAPPGVTLELHRELPGQAIVAGGGSLLRARIDRLVVTRLEGRAIAAEIVDWKTDGLLAPGSDPTDQPSPLGAGALSDKLRTYRAQLESYRDLVSRALGLPVGKITVALALVATGQVVELPPAS